MAFALIENGVVHNLLDRDELPPMHHALAAKYRKLAPSEKAVVREGWLFDGDRFSAPPPEPPRPIVPSIEDVLDILETHGSPAMRVAAAAKRVRPT